MIGTSEAEAQKNRPGPGVRGRLSIGGSRPRRSLAAGIDFAVGTFDDHSKGRSAALAAVACEGVHMFAQRVGHHRRGGLAVVVVVVVAGLSVACVPDPPPPTTTTSTTAVSNGPIPVNETGLAEEADYCVLQFPTSVTVTTSSPPTLVYGRIFESGITEPAGGSPTVQAELGVGPVGTDPRVAPGWTFVPATFNAQIGNDDEYIGTLPPQPVGAYAYTYRFSLDGGQTATYCDVDGAGSNPGLDFDPAELGLLTVQ